MKAVLILLVIGLAISSGCVSQGGEPPVGNGPEDAKAKCIYLCQFEKASGTDLSEGPCLSDDNPDWEVGNWVCDVAHDPRQDVDDSPENQCEEYISGQAQHFVEVDAECNFIKSL